MNSKTIALIAVLVLALFAAGCGDDDEKDTAGDSGQDTTSTPEATNGPGQDSKTGVPDVTGSPSEKPEISKPSGEPPSVLVSKDIKKGDGAKAESGDTLSMQYVGIDWTNGEQFDASWDNGQPFEFALGTGGVIQGWDEGIEGMREGGRRMLVIPPDLAYGPQGSPPAIGPNETLVFVVDLEKVTKP